MRSLEQVNIRTNVRTYVRTYSHTYVRDRPYIPSTTLLCEGIIMLMDTISQPVVFKGIDQTVNNHYKNISIMRPYT